MKKYSAIVIAIILGFTAFHGEWSPPTTRQLASDENTVDLSYLPDFDYRMTDVGGKEAVDELYNILTDDLDKNPNNVCHNRAHMWAYQMYRLKNVNSGKVLIIYGRDSHESGEVGAYAKKPYSETNVGAYGAAGYRWWFHIAPYVISEGQEIVMEKMFKLNTPTPMKDWLAHMTGGRECKVLDGTGSETVVYDYMRKANSVPTAEGGHPCYIRKMPMGYLGPQSAYNHDIRKYIYPNELTDGLVMSSCLNSLAGKRKMFRKKLCQQFLANPVDMSFKPMPSQ